VPGDVLCASSSEDEQNANGEEYGRTRNMRGEPEQGNKYSEITAKLERAGQDDKQE
jgi:hypothetical protein